MTIADSSQDAAPQLPRTRRMALSASRAKDFKQCPLMFRFRTVDQIPDPGSLATHRGTIVHAVLERLYDLPPLQRVEAEALNMLPEVWGAHRAAHPEIEGLFDSPDAVEPWLHETRTLISHYFALERPSRLQPAEREMFVQATTRTGLLLRGFVDRLDIAPDGAMRVVDYKTGRSPAPRFQEEALFQMRFYAFVLWRLRGQMPRRLQLIYLKDGRILTHDPHIAEVESFEHLLDQLWDDIEGCAHAGDFPPRKTPLCSWCNFQSFCPLFGGTTPPLPADGVTHLLSARRQDDGARTGQTTLG